MPRDSIRVLIATKLNSIAREVLQESGILVDQIEEYSPEEFVNMIGNYHAVIVRSDPVNAAAIEKAHNLKLIVRAGSGVNTIDVNAATKNNVMVMNTPAANSNAVAELVFGLMISACRHIPKADQSVRRGEWLKKEFMGTELSGKTLGIIGLGEIGSRIVPKAKAFEMQVVGYDPLLAPERARGMGIEVMSLEELCRRSNFITLHVPLNPATKGMITYDLLRLLPDGALIINTARAEIIDKVSLEKVLEERTSIRAAVDFFHEGDKAGEKSISRFGDKVLCTPHIGASTSDANYRAARMSAVQTVDFFQKGVISYPVNIINAPIGLNFKYMELAREIGNIAFHNIKGFGQVSEILITCYGRLYKYTDILVKSGISGVMSEYMDDIVTPAMAEKLAEDHGIKIVKRQPDDVKGHGDSITLDIVVEDKQKGSIAETSVRGTVTEEETVPVIRRIDKFENIDIIPEGNITVFVYDDRKGISGYIGEQFSEHDINILDGRYKTSSDNKFAIAILNTNKVVEPALVKEIQAHIDAHRAFSLHYTKKSAGGGIG